MSPAVFRLAIARGVTFLGGNAAFWALSAILYEKTQSPCWVALGVLTSFSLPAVLSPIAGLLGDRIDRKRVMVISELAGAFCFGALAPVGSPAALLALRGLASVASAPMVSTTSAVLPSLVPAGELERANAVLSNAGTAGGLLGTAVAGVMLTTMGGPSVFLLNAFTFLISAILVGSIKGGFQPDVTERGALTAGFSFLRRHRRLRPATLSYAVLFAGIGVSIPAEVVLATSFGVGSSGYAMLVCLWGIGAIAGAAAAKRFSGPKREGVAIFGAAVALAAGFLAVSTAPLFAVALLGMAVGGAGEGLWGVTQNSLIQRLAPDGVRGRVFAGSEAVMQAGITLGLLCSGVVISAGGPSGACAVAGGAAMLAALILLPGLVGQPHFASPPPRLLLGFPRAEMREREPDGTSPVAGRSAPASPPVAAQVVLTP
jgi:MFS family permease